MYHAGNERRLNGISSYDTTIEDRLCFGTSTSKRVTFKVSDRAAPKRCLILSTTTPSTMLPTRELTALPMLLKMYNANDVQSWLF
jgi:hypothetical protein